MALLQLLLDFLYLFGPILVVSALGARGEERLRVRAAAIALAVSAIALLVDDWRTGLLGAVAPAASFATLLKLQTARPWLRVVAGIGAGLGTLAVLAALLF
jgi:hypothetical protein